MTKNNLFDNDSLDVILNPGNWQVICSLFTPEVDFVIDPVHRQWMKKNTESHPAREVLFALKGETRYGFMNAIYPCFPGTIFFFNSYESHDTYYPKCCPDVLHLWISLFEHDAVVKVILVENGKMRILWTPIPFNKDRMACLLATTWDEAAAFNALPSLFIRTKLLTSFSALLLQIIERGFGKIKSLSQSNFHEQVIETIRRHIANTAGRDVPAAEAARLAGYSEFHFQRLFKRETGLTFHQYVDACRLKKAKAMLNEHRLKTEIAEELGFSHPSTFLRWLKSRK